MHRKAHVACNCLFENEGLLKVTASYVHSICGNILETVQNGVVVYGLSNRGNSDDLKLHSMSFTYCKPFQM